MQITLIQLQTHTKKFHHSRSFSQNAQKNRKFIEFVCFEVTIDYSSQNTKKSFFQNQKEDFMNNQIQFINITVYNRDFLLLQSIKHTIS